MMLYVVQVIAFRDLASDVISKISIFAIFVIWHANWSRTFIVDVFTIYLGFKLYWLASEILLVIATKPKSEGIFAILLFVLLHFAKALPS